MVREIVEATIGQQAEVLGSLCSETTLDEIERAVATIHDSDGKVITAGIGKSGDVAEKISSTLTSVGVPSLFLHPVEAQHGDIGLIEPESDVVILISNSGNTDEVVELLHLLDEETTSIAITSNAESKLARRTDHRIITGVKEEASLVDLVPMTSSTVAMVIGDAIANGIMKRDDFDQSDFAYFHPGGVIGKQLRMAVEDVMEPDIPETKAADTIPETTLKMSRGGKGVGVVVDDAGVVEGVVTDGDIRRLIESEQAVEDVRAGDVITEDPVTVTVGTSVLEALNVLERYDITQVVVEEDGEFAGVVHFHDIMQEGLVDQ